MNYDAGKQTCEIISSHASLLGVQVNNNYTFAAFDNRYHFQNTGVDKDCINGPVKWKQQSKKRHVEFQNVIHSNDSVKDSPVYKVTFGDNEIPGVVTVNDKRCMFIHKYRTGFYDFYRVLVFNSDSGLTASWVTYTAARAIPEGSFFGGHSDQGAPVYICRAAINAIYYTGYHDPATAMSYTHSGNVNHPKVVDILAFIINGPNYAGPTGDLPCHRYHVCLASTGYDMVEHWGNDPLPDSVVTSNEKLSLGMSSTVCNIMSKFIVNMNSFWMVYGSSNGAQTWESLMLTSLFYEWLPYQAGSDVPYNALVLSYTIENVPLYAFMK